MSDLGEKPRRGKPGAQSGPAFIEDSREQIKLRPEEEWGSQLYRSLGEGVYNAAGLVPTAQPAYDIYKHYSEGNEDLPVGPIARGATELGMASLGLGAAKDLSLARKFGDYVYTPKTDAFLTTFGIPGVAPSKSLMDAARGLPGSGLPPRATAPHDTANAERYAAEVAKRAEWKRAQKELDDEMDALEGLERYNKRNRFTGALDRDPRFSNPPKPEMPGGYAEQTLGRRGMDIDAAGILNGWKVPKDALPNAAGGAVRGGYADGGIVSGALKSEYGQGGRTDDLPVNVGSGSFVIPADCVSALGQGSSDAGHKILERMFPASPAAPQMASGGSVPIIAAVDEHILSPEQVAAVGEGDVDLGHRILDQFVLDVRKNHIKTLKGLPPPAK